MSKLKPIDIAFERKDVDNIKGNKPLIFLLQFPFPESIHTTPRMIFFFFWVYIKIKIAENFSSYLVLDYFNSLN